MVTLKSPREIDTMARAGAIVEATLKLCRRLVKPGISTEDLDREAEAFIRSHRGAKPSFKGLYGFPKSLCISVNEEVVHGIPSHRRILKEGNIVSIDCGVCIDGFHADSAITVPVGEVAPAVTRFLATTERALAAGIEQAVLGNFTGDIGHAIQAVSEAGGYGVIRELVGHGVGTRMHEDPQVPNHGKPKRGERLLEGLTIAIEPMITMGDYKTKLLPDKWTVVTADGSMAAHFEHTVAITKSGPRILTKAA
ncbi:MAG: type I methionyl aminopeptidase [Gemmatimonadetes bacterium]|nr:type I methionyl aminopeptidase [Gemmatimonadota bacterium]